jgi:hypothetical protein
VVKDCSFANHKDPKIWNVDLKTRGPSWVKENNVLVEHNESSAYHDEDSMSEPEQENIPSTQSLRCSTRITRLPIHYRGASYAKAMEPRLIQKGNDNPSIMKHEKAKTKINGLPLLNKRKTTWCLRRTNK